jgi:hypothetical protein
MVQQEGIRSKEVDKHHAQKFEEKSIIFQRKL